jgi:SAM-dependent methyltransferase
MTPTSPETRPTGLDERTRREAHIYDSRALRRDTYDRVLEHADNGPARLRRDTHIRTILERQAGGRVLEIGSSAWEGMLHRWGIRPSNLTCINISQAEIEYGRQRAALVGAAVEFHRMDAHSLEFPDESFDFVFGIAILHHLEFGRALREIHRVLSPGGSMLFIEPLALNPIARLVRRLTPWARTPDERPLGREELRLVESLFETSHLYTDLFHFPAAVASRFLFSHPVNPLTRAFDALDRAILQTVPPAGPYYRAVTVHGRKRVA